MAQPGNEALSQIVRKLSTEYYGPLEIRCDAINGYIDRPDNSALPIAHVNYSSVLTGEIKRFIEQRSLVFMPYLIELSEKSMTGHDCAHCSGRCDMQHTLKLLEFTDSISKMESTSRYLQSEFAAMDNVRKEHSEALAWLRSEMKLLWDMLAALLKMEELLIADIKYAQKTINAHS